MIRLALARGFRAPACGVPRNDGYARRLSFAIAKVAQCLTGFLHGRAVRGQLREEPGEGMQVRSRVTGRLIRSRDFH